jgi:tetratricopeptide (TPR) repeat protein
MEIKSCPLCKWPEWEEGEGEVDRDQLLEHVAKDLHSFSLRALPWADDSGQETHERIRYSSDKVFDWLVQHELLEGPDRERPPLERKAYMSKYFPPNPYFRDSSVASSSDNSKSTASREKDLRKWKEEEGPVHFERNESEVRSDISGTRVDGVKLDHLISESSLLRVATLADELVSLCAFHEEALLIDPSDPKRLRRYVHAMKVTLQEALERDESSKSRLYSSQQMGSALRECELRLQHSINILERSTKANRITRAPWPLEWPFIPKEIDDTILILQRTQALMGSVPMPDIDLAELQSKQEVEDESSDQIVLSQTPDEFFDNHSESLENSLKLLQTALNVREKYLGPENERTLLIVYHIGSVLFSLGRYEEAERAFERLIEIDSPLTIISKAHIELARYNTTGLGKHLEWGIAAAERATHRAMGPGEIQERQRIFVRLLTARFDCDDNLGDLEEAITTLQNIIAENGIVPSQRSVGPLKELGRLVLKHYQRAGDISYTERAFTFMINSFVTPNEPLIHSGVLEQLSHLYLLLCKETRDYGHLEAAIYGIQKFVAFMNSDHPSSVSLLDNLSQLFLMRFNATGNLEDLEKSIEYMQIVIGATPDGHPGITEMLSDVGLLSDYFRMLRFRMDTAPNNPSQNSSQAPAEDHVAASELSPNYFKTFFVVEKELGRGSKGVVLLVRHELDGVELGIVNENERSHSNRDTNRPRALCS